ncbi:MAG: EAL domain-containing protein [Pseudomonadaceae bacterium]|nr:MAG: EAL domain-containing protein [Pseudomonadaceae bacterium]
MWIAIGFLVAIMFSSSMALSFFAAKSYLEEQLALKNVDNANMLALTLGHGNKDLELMEMFLLAQFDLGHYQRLELYSAQGESLFNLRPERPEQGQVPAWFQRLISFNVPAGSALVSSGWQPLGRLEVESHDAFAHEALWRNAWQLLLSMLVLAILSGLLGSWLLKRIIRPLDIVIRQAEAIGEQRFLTAKEPSTLEFGRLVKAMNRLSSRVKTMLAAESARLEKLRYQFEHDPLTNVCNRSFFFGQLDDCLSDQRGQHDYALFLIRVDDLVELNVRMGHANCDRLLQELADGIRSVLDGVDDEFDEAFLGRLNGADFAIVLKGVAGFERVAARFSGLIAALSAQHPELVLFQSGSRFVSGESRQKVMLRADALLAQAEMSGVTCALVDEHTNAEILFRSADEWRQALFGSLEHGIGIQLYPVCKANGELLHHEAMMRLELAGQVRAASYFMPWAQRLGIQPELDLALLKKVLLGMQTGELPGVVAVNLCPDIALRADYLHRLEGILAAFPNETQRLCVECPERIALDMQGFSLFAEKVSGFGCGVGIDGAGRSIQAATTAYISGLGYIKIAGVYAQRLADVDDKDVSGFVQRVCNLSHTMGMVVILEGVSSPEITERALEMGFDGLTGPAIRLAED